MTVKSLSPKYIPPSPDYVCAIWRRLREASNALLRRRETVRKLQWLGDRDLADIGLRRCDIPKVVRKMGTELRTTIDDDGAKHP